MNIVEKLKCRGIVPRAALYARFSSDNQREESIEAQLRAMHDFCEKSGITVVREFCDHAKSATTDDRPEFQNMIDSEKCGDFDLELVPEFFRAMAREGGITLHIAILEADNSHHAAEAAFKGVGMALPQGNAHILGEVVAVDVDVANRLQSNSKPGPVAHQVQHVGKKSAVDIELPLCAWVLKLKRYLRLFCFACKLCPHSVISRF